MKYAVIALAIPLYSNAITLQSPHEFQVFQRHSVDTGTITVAGSVEALSVEKVHITITKDATTIHESTAAVLYQAFGQTLELPAGGWYKVVVETVDATESATVEKCGIGEIFIVAGQSNASNCGWPPTKTQTGMVAAFDGAHWRLGDDPNFGNRDGCVGGSPWPKFGDIMAEKFGVPIGIASVAYGGTTVDEWLPSPPLFYYVGDKCVTLATILGYNVSPETKRLFTEKQLFQTLVQRIQLFGAHKCAAVLWHQGETDVAWGTEQEKYYARLEKLIEAVRETVQWDVPWFVAQASFYPDEFINPTLKYIWGKLGYSFNATVNGLAVSQAQQDIWQADIALEGVNTDTLMDDYRSDLLHFNEAGLKAHAALWAEKVGAWLLMRYDRRGANT